ncbi:hypothetical protein [Turicimonas muris]|uniref:hypothetical protein n=1 Tax=Turicimonas muris TaxID=1796652 RepID=UPI003F676416
MACFLRVGHFMFIMFADLIPKRWDLADGINIVVLSLDVVFTNHLNRLVWLLTVVSNAIMKTLGSADKEQ